MSVVFLIFNHPRVAGEGSSENMGVFCFFADVCLFEIFTVFKGTSADFKHCFGDRNRLERMAFAKAVAFNAFESRCECNFFKAFAGVESKGLNDFHACGNVDRLERVAECEHVVTDDRDSFL